MSQVSRERDLTPLSRLITANSIIVVETPGETLPPALRLRTRSPCRRKSRGPADMALIVGSNANREASLQGTAAHRAPARLLLRTHPGQQRPCPPPAAESHAIALGPGGAFWTQHWQVGLPNVAAGQRASRPTSGGRANSASASAQDGGAGAPLLVVTQAPSFIAPVIEATARCDLRVQAAISTGTADDRYWAALLNHIATPILLILQHDVDPRILVAAARRTPANAVVALLVGPARRLKRPPRDTMGGSKPIGTTHLATALGWPTFSVMEQALEAVRLLALGLKPHHGQVMGLADTPERAALLAQTLASTGIGLAPIRRTAGQTNPLPTLDGILLAGPEPASGTLRRPPPTTDDIDAIISAGRVTLPVAGNSPQLEIFPRQRGSTLPLAHESTLRAMATLLDTAAVRLTAVTDNERSRSEARTRAETLLREWPAQLCEHQIKQILSCYGLRSPAEQLVGSPSAAAQAATMVGLPVALKPVGPSLRERSSWGAVALHLPTAATVRQAFRDIVHACRENRPNEPLRGVLVSRMAALPPALDCTLVSVDASTFLHIALSGQGRAPPDVLITLHCPIDARQAARIAQRLCRITSVAGRSRRPNARDRNLLADFLRALAQAGADLRGSIAWLQLDTVSLPADGDPPYIVDARARRQP